MVQGKCPIRGLAGMNAEYCSQGYDLCSNARARPTHATALGWKPKQKKAEFLASLRREVEGCIEKPFPLKPIRP